MAASSKASTSDDLEETNDVLPGFPDTKTFSQKTLQAVIGAIRQSNELPCAGDDWDYYSSFQSFRELMSIEGRRLMQMMQDILKHQNVKSSISSGSQESELEEKFDMLVDGNDLILERVGSLLDEAAGLKKTDAKLVVASVTPKQQINTSWNKKSSVSPAQKSASFRLLAARYIQRPQLKFLDPVDNSSRPFVPKIQKKPNAKKELPDNWLSNLDEQMDQNGEVSDMYFANPYQYELDHFVPLPEQLTRTNPREPPSVVETPLIMVTTVAELEKMNEQLKKETEIAIDLEHHSYRTFLGITCLMQISTRSQDYIVDCLDLRSDLQLLNEVLTDPSIVKVLHGSDSDIEWLQRDLGLYVVNMFDTGQAARVLNFARFALSFLLKHYCNVQADKQYQLADWRIRPLPEELIQYAREDTHYLLYIYDRMKNELLDRGNEQGNLLHSVLQRSGQICGKVYKKPMFTEESHLELLYRSKKVFNSQQVMALKGIYAWRDKAARQEDESTGYVLPNHMLLQIAEILPRESQGILACCNPIPPLVKQDLVDLHRLVMEARESPLLKVAPRVKKETLPSKQQHPMYNARGVLTCPHDLSHQGEHSTVDTLLDTSMVAKKSSLFKDSGVIQLKTSPIISALAWSAEDAIKKCNLTAREKAAKISSAFSSPFQKFLPTALVDMPGTSEKMSFCHSGVGKIHLVNQRWRLMKNSPKEVKPSVSSGHTNKQAVDIMTPQPSSQDLISPLSLREQMPSSSDKKKKNNKSAEEFLDNLAKELSEQGQGTSEHDSAAVKTNDKLERKKRKREEKESAAAAVEPFEYSKTDMKIFEESANKKQKKRKKEFNPDAFQHKFKAPSKPKLNPSSGKKSQTFSSHQSRGSQQSWPKR